MYTLFIILIVFAALLMVGIVLIQESKGGGLASNFASYNQIGGVRKTTDFIEKATWGLAAFMVIMSIACSYVLPSAKTSLLLPIPTTCLPSAQALHSRRKQQLLLKKQHLPKKQSKKRISLKTYSPIRLMRMGFSFALSSFSYPFQSFFNPFSTTIFKKSPHFIWKSQIKAVPLHTL